LSDVLAAALLLAAAAMGAPSPGAELATMPPLAPRDRVLIVAPHPDDESLCCAGLIQEARSRGAAVGVVWVTDGDGFEIDAIVMEHTLHPHGAASRRLGSQRLREAHVAADLLGVPRRFQYVLGYPDRDLRALLGPNLTQPLQSTYTRVSAVATAEARSPGAAYTGTNLARDLDGVLADFAPTLVLAAAPQDRHSDHVASGELVARLLAARGQSAALRWWIVHAGHRWPVPRRYRPALELTVPRLAQTLAWQSLPLSAEQVQRKLAAVDMHRTQTEVMKPFLHSFVRRNELFAIPAMTKN
jgi:LmbE family N-acetylglucosaminyl deacetylase